MTDAQLTTLSTILWLVGTCTLFVLLAHWSAGGSWGISSAIARGLTGWTGRTTGGARPASDLPAMESPRLDRLWGADPRGLEVASPALADSSTAPSPVAELEDLGARRLP